MRITRHFRDRWRTRVGGRVPSPAEIAGMLMESVRIQRSMNLYLRRKRRFERFNLLACYWHPMRQVVLKIDESSRERVAVSVLSSANARAIDFNAMRVVRR